MEFFNGFTAGDVAVGFIGAVVEVAILVSNLPGKMYLMAGGLVIIALLLLKMDDERNYEFLLNILRHYAYRRNYAKEQTGRKKRRKGGKAPEDIRRVIAYTGIQDGLILYEKKYYGAVLELPSVEFRFFSEFRQNNTIEKALGGVLRNVNPNYAANLVKIERPVIYDKFVQAEHRKIEDLKNAYCRGMLTAEELERRIEIINDRIAELNELSFENKVVLPYFYLVLFDSDRNLLNNQVQTAIELLRNGELSPHRLDDRELAVFLKYTQSLDFDERDALELQPEEYYEFSLPEKLDIYAKNIVVNNILTHNFRVVNYPMTVTNAWGAFVFDTPATKVVMKMKPMDRTKAIRAIDRSIDELRSQENSTGKTSKLIDISTHIDTLSELLIMLQNDNEILMNVNIYVTGYDWEGSMAEPRIKEKPEDSALPHMTNLKKNIRRIYNDSNMKLNDSLFLQMEAWIAGQVSGYDPREGKGRSIHSSSVAAVFPFVYTYTADEGGINLGKKNNVPVFIDFFRRDSERVNSNMAIIGKSGSGKSYATKTLLSNLAAENSKIFVLDPENEYLELAHNLGGKIINVGNATQGRLNPFQIITNLEDDEEGEQQASGVSFHTHLQFLEEFFKQILPEIEPDALEYLNNLIIRIYSMKGIEEHTDLSKLKPEDYPIFDDLYDTVLEEFQSTKSDYLKGNLQILINYIAKFSSGGRNSVLWNGHSTINTEENFIVFNFQSLLANRNNLIANAQMLLVLKWLDNEIIKNRDYNKKYHASRKIVVVIDEAHVFIDTKYPLALDFMFQLAKRIRKYNGMQIVITQNIKDFVGSEELARKSTAIINACQYSLIFALAPNDMHDLCKLYEKAGQINEQEQEEIINAARGQAFVITSPTNRSSLVVEANKNVQSLFTDSEFESPYYSDQEGKEWWDNIIRTLDAEREEEDLAQFKMLLEEEEEQEALEMPARPSGQRVKIVEISEEDMVSEDVPEPAYGYGQSLPGEPAYGYGRNPSGNPVYGYGQNEQGSSMYGNGPVRAGNSAYGHPGANDSRSQNYEAGALSEEELIEELRNSLRQELMDELRSSLAMQQNMGTKQPMGGQKRASAASPLRQRDVGAEQEDGEQTEIYASKDSGEDWSVLPDDLGYDESQAGYEELDTEFIGTDDEEADGGYLDGDYEETDDGYVDDGYEETDDGYVDGDYEESDDGYLDDGYEESDGDYLDDGYEESDDGYPEDEETEADRMEREFYEMFGMIEQAEEDGVMAESAENLEDRYAAEPEEAEEFHESDGIIDFESYLEDIMREAEEALVDDEEEAAQVRRGDELVWEITYEELMQSA